MDWQLRNLSWKLFLSVFSKASILSKEVVDKIGPVNAINMYLIRWPRKEACIFSGNFALYDTLQGKNNFVKSFIF